jgi:Glycosyl hydrolases family 28
MSDDTTNSVSRRRWMEMTSAPVVAGALGTALAAQQAFAAEDGRAAVPTDRSDFGARNYNVRDFGALGDGKTLDTVSIQAAVDACAKDRGGIVFIPAGDFLIGPIELKSNVTLHIAAGGKLLATTDASQYHPARGIPLTGDHTMGDGNVGLIYGANAENVAIEGQGTIDGQGAQVRAGGLGGARRPHLVLFYKCTNLSIRDVHLFQSAYHTCRIANSSYVHLDGIRITSRVTGNNDGFHFISCEFVNLMNSNVRCQDDACALFGSCKFVMVTNCSFSTRWSVFRFGGGVAENIAVSNCVLYQVFGCPIKLRCGPGSRYENMSFSNLLLQEVTGPISIGSGPQRTGDAKVPSDAKQATTPDDTANWPGGVVRNISFSNISGTVTTEQGQLADSTFTGGKNPGELHSCIVLNGVDGTYLENISLSDIRLTFGGGGTAEEGARRELPQIAGEYFALGAMPAYGLYARNVRGLTLNNIRFQVAKPELRPAVILDKVHDAAIDGLSAQANAQAESLVRLMNTTDTLITAPRVLSAAAVFLRVEGPQSRNITVDGGDLSKAEKPLAFADGADEGAVKLRS